jgi:hypothetical protein
METGTAQMAENFCTYWSVVEKWAEFEALIASGELSRRHRGALVLVQARRLLREHEHRGGQLCLGCEHVLRLYALAESEADKPQPARAPQGWSEVAKRYRRLAKAARNASAWRQYALRALRADDRCWAFSPAERFELLFLAATPPH